MSFQNLLKPGSKQGMLHKMFEMFYGIQISRWGSVYTNLQAPNGY